MMAYLSIPFLIFVGVILLIRFLCDLWDDIGK